VSALRVCLLFCTAGGHMGGTVWRTNWRCVQPGAPGPIRAGVQPRGLPAPVRSSKRGFSLVSLKHSAEAHKDWSQDRLPLQDNRLPDG